VQVYEGVAFENWGESVQNTPKYTFVPSTVLGLQNLVKFTKQNGLRVRCSGYRHSWSPIFSSDNEILVSLLDLEEVTTVPDSLAIGPDAEPNGNELMSIDILEKPAFLSSGKNCVRVGAAVTNEAFRRWAIHHNVTALPMDVILVEYVNHQIFVIL
jgi:FAD/FMN-containing dehydrogenase